MPPSPSSRRSVTVSGHQVDISDEDAVAALADTVYAAHGHVQPAVQQRRGHLRRRRQAVAAGAERLALVLRRERVRHWRSAPRVRAPHDRRRPSRARSSTPRRATAGSPRCRWRRCTRHRRPRSAASPSRSTTTSCSEGTALRASVFYPSGGLLRTGLFTAARNRPEHLPATGRGHRPTSMTFDQLKDDAGEGGPRRHRGRPRRARRLRRRRKRPPAGTSSPATSTTPSTCSTAGPTPSAGARSPRITACRCSAGRARDRVTT